jgi:hypothetical protein
VGELDSNRLRWSISSAAGVLVIILFCGFTFTSWALYPTSYNPVDNWLSDLGNSSYNPQGAIFFNAGCVLTGITLFPFFSGLYKWYTEESWRKISLIITQTVGSLAAFSVMMIGVFSEDYGEMHHLWSTVFFAFIFIVFILLGVSLFTHPKYTRKIAYYGFAVAIIDLIFASYNVPLLEWLTVFTALGYVGLLAYNMFTAKFSP